MSELEKSSALVGDIYEAITQPDALAGSFRQMGAGGSPIDSRRAAVKFSTSSRCPQTWILVTDENTFSHHSA